MVNMEVIKDMIQEKKVDKHADVYDIQAKEIKVIKLELMLQNDYDVTFNQVIEMTDLLEEELILLLVEFKTQLEVYTNLMEGIKDLTPEYLEAITLDYNIKNYIGKQPKKFTITDVCKTFGIKNDRIADMENRYGVPIQLFRREIDSKIDEEYTHEDFLNKVEDLEILKNNNKHKLADLESDIKIMLLNRKRLIHEIKKQTEEQTMIFGILDSIKTDGENTEILNDLTTGVREVEEESTLISDLFNMIEEEPKVKQDKQVTTVKPAVKEEKEVELNKDELHVQLYKLMLLNKGQITKQEVAKTLDINVNALPLLLDKIINEYDVDFRYQFKKPELTDEYKDKYGISLNDNANLDYYVFERDRVTDEEKMLPVYNEGELGKPSGLKRNRLTSIIKYIEAKGEQVTDKELLDRFNFKMLELNVYYRGGYLQGYDVYLEKPYKPKQNTMRLIDQANAIIRAEPGEITMADLINRTGMSGATVKIYIEEGLIDVENMDFRGKYVLVNEEDGK